MILLILNHSKDIYLVAQNFVSVYIDESSLFVAKHVVSSLRDVVLFFFKFKLSERLSSFFGLFSYCISTIFFFSFFTESTTKKGSGSWWITNGSKRWLKLTSKNRSLKQNGFFTKVVPATNNSSDDDDDDDSEEEEMTDLKIESGKKEEEAKWF